MHSNRILAAVVAAAVLAVPAVAEAKTCTSKTTGTCTTKAGQTVKIANRSQTLKLKSAAVKIIGNATVPTIGPFNVSEFDPVGDSATAKGRYVVFVVKVTNRGSEPLDTILDLDFGLKLGKATYDNAFNAENLNGSPALINAAENNTIQPGLSATGYIAFDVARNRSALVRKNGNLRVDDDSDRRLGIIRTYR